MSKHERYYLLLFVSLFLKPLFCFTAPQRGWRKSELNHVKQHFSAGIVVIPPIRLIGKGRRIPTWTIEANSAGAPPISPVMTDEPEKDLVLIPYGSARLRIAEFPIVRRLE